MNYSQFFFGKDLAKLLYQDIVNYFIDVNEENDKIEFKSFTTRNSNTLEEKFKGIFKSCCAFLNSEGGIIIWGAPIGNIPNGRKEKIFQGDLSPINQILEKDHIINRVSSNLTPIPNGINVKIIPDATKTNCICIFEIQRSEYAPHQFENIYYMRLDGQSRPAPHHYIEALFKQIKYPNLEGYLKFNSIEIINSPNTVSLLRLNFEILIFNFSSLQNETNVSFILTCESGIFPNWSFSQTAHEYSMNGHQFVKEKFADVLHFGVPRRINSYIDFNPHEIINSNNQARLILQFGGKNSPLKQSEYLISIELKSIGQNLNDIIVEKNENKLMSDLQIGIGITKELQLREILGR